MGTRAENKWSYHTTKTMRIKMIIVSLYHLMNMLKDTHIDKKDYLIGNFYDLTPDFEETPIDDYVEDYN